MHASLCSKTVEAKHTWSKHGASLYLHASPCSSNESSDMLSTADARSRHVREAEVKERAGKVRCREAQNRKKEGACWQGCRAAAL